MKAKVSVLATLGSICLSLPDTEEGTAWKHPVFRVGRMCCGHEKINGIWTVGFKADSLHAGFREQDPRIVAVQNFGKHRWLSMDASQIHDRDDVQDAIMESYRLAAPKRSLTKLGATSAPSSRRTRPRRRKGKASRP